MDFGLGDENSFQKAKSFHVLDEKHSDLSQFVSVDVSVVLGSLV